MDKIQEALYQNNFDTVLALLKGGEKWQLNGFDASQAYTNIIKSENFELINYFIDKEILSLDIFEYDSFQYTLFEVFTKIQMTDGIISFLKNIIGDLENIDDELENKTWLGIAIENKATALMEILIDNGCDINTINSNEESYLFLTQD